METLFRQKCSPLVVFSDPMSRKKGMQVDVIVTAKGHIEWSVGIFVIPNTEVTNVNGLIIVSIIDEQM